ncbi:RHS repeat protein [Candidatus Sumerlaeota bacterium]|nr:RHS repeat protein [Candidatus Sumerlaeota bacterium]
MLGLRYSNARRPLIVAALVLLTIAWGAMRANAAPGTTYLYDNEQRLTRVAYPSGQEVTYTYDNAGNILSETVTGDDLHGTVQVRVTPSAASWVLVDSVGESHSGTGDQDVSNVAIGRVDLFWQPLVGMFAPSVNPAWGALAAGANLTLEGLYTFPETRVRIWAIWE